MLDDFLDWVNEQLARYGLGGVLSATIGILGAAGALSVIFGSEVIAGAVSTSIGFAVLVFFVAAIRHETQARRSVGMAYALLQRYCYLVEEMSPAELNVDDWEQVITLDGKGNAKIVRKIDLMPAGGPLHFLRLRLSYGGHTEQSQRIRRRVAAVARQVSGARWESTQFWKDGKTHEVLVHFGQPIAEGSPVSVEVEWTWPLYSSELMTGGCEDFYIDFPHSVRRAQHTVFLPVGPGGELPSVSAYLVRHSAEREGGLCKIAFEVEPCARNTRYSIRIDSSGLRGSARLFRGQVPAGRYHQITRATDTSVTLIEPVRISAATVA